MKFADSTVLTRRIMRNRLCSWVFKSTSDAYLVGGHLRDLIINGSHPADSDFVVTRNVRSLARRAAAAFGGTVVELRKEAMHRVALPGRKTLDFSILRGDILDDLNQRDFSINALGWSPSTGLLDPCGGLTDIKRRRVRAISGENLIADPLRLLRAYRFSAELEMPIAKSTRELIRPLSRAIRKTSRERITLEFLKLLSASAPLDALGQALEDGLLNQIIPLNNKRLEYNLKLISALSLIPNKLREKEYFKEFSQGLSRLGLLRLEILMLGARLNDSLLSVSSPIKQHVDVAARLYELAISGLISSSSELFQLFWEAGEVAEDLLLISGNQHLVPDLLRFRSINARALVSSKEIMAATGLKGGPDLGRIIRSLRLLQFTGRLKTKRQAIRRISSTGVINTD